MFQMLNEESARPPDRKMAIVRVGALTVALLALVPGGLLLCPPSVRQSLSAAESRNSVRPLPWQADVHIWWRCSFSISQFSS